MKYVKKPVIIEAVQWNGDNFLELDKFMKYGRDFKVIPSKPYDNVYIFTLEGTHQASVGDFIIKGIKGEFYPCKPDIFELTYNKIDE